MKVEASTVSAMTSRDADASGSCGQLKTASASIWTEAMLAALKSGVKGGKWHSLIDKVYRVETLKLGWIQVAKNAGAAGVDRMSVEQFARKRDLYLTELAQALRDGSYRPQAVRRVYIPKAGSKTQFRPLGVPTVNANCTSAQCAFGICRNQSSFSSVKRPALCSAKDAANRRRRYANSQIRWTRQF